MTINTNFNKLNNPWVIWYHNPSDNNWDIKSYHNLYEINTVEEYCKFENTRKIHLPKLSESMFFIMRKLNEYEYVYPMWEDENNKQGGCWSFKINSESIEEIWKILTIYLIGENLGTNVTNSLNINGMSISPKKGFCIVKIWNNDSNDNDVLEIINNKLGSYIDLDTCFYKSHVENISKDQKKREKREKFMKMKDRNTHTHRHRNKNWSKKNHFWKN